MSKASKEEQIETRGYLQGIAEGLYRAMRYLNERSGESYKRRDDKRSEFYRVASDEIAKLATQAQETRDAEFPRDAGKRERTGDLRHE